jgi:hypothetical protein
MTFETDPLLRRLLTGAAVWCAAATGLAMVVWPGRWDIAAGILGGGVLTGVSFLAIKSSIDAILRRLPARPAEASEGAGDGRVDTAPRASLTLVKLVGRYGLLALLAYVMIARLRLHPLGLVAGASSLVASASFEAARWVSGGRPVPPRAN